MQNLNRFVTYVYSYRGYERDVNVGFAKVDRRGDFVRMEIQIRKKDSGKGETEICLLTADPKNPLAIPIGTMHFEGDTGTYQGRIRAENIAGSGYGFDQITGLYLKNEEALYASQWIEEDLQLGSVILFKTGNEKEEERSGIQKEAAFETEQRKSDAQKEAASGKLAAAQCHVSKEENTLKAMEGNPLYDWRYEWEKLDQGPDKELVLGIALWTRNKGKS